LLVNLLLLANLEERSIYKELNCFLEVRNNILEEDNLANKAIGNVFALFWKGCTVLLLVVEVLSYF